MADKQTSEKMAHLAAEVLRNKQSSEIEKSLAGSVLSEAAPDRKPSANEIEMAKKVVDGKAHHSKECVELAEVILSLAK
ncbi:MAG: hypothetical protein K2H64_06720 [Desulfovibrio sp.]|nr:hypothetical protein [Desulfovibrio sp.]